MSSQELPHMPKTERSSSSTSTASISSTTSTWLELTCDRHLATSASSASPVFLDPAPAVNKTAPAFRPTENTEDRQRLFLLRARNN